MNNIDFFLLSDKIYIIYSLENNWLQKSQDSHYRNILYIMDRKNDFAEVSKKLAEYKTGNLNFV